MIALGCLSFVHMVDYIQRYLSRVNTQGALCGLVRTAHGFSTSLPPTPCHYTPSSHWW